jgi:GTPase
MTPAGNHSRHDQPPGFRSGFIALVGRPNVGKSTLLNRMVGEMVAIVTHRPQTTRSRIRGIVNRPGVQMVFLDTPGIHLPPGSRAPEPDSEPKEKAIHRYMAAEAQAALGEVDLNVLLVEAKGRGSRPGYGSEDQLVLDSIRKTGRPTLLAINKIDLIKDKQQLLPLMEAYRDTGLIEDMIPVSALKGDGIDALLSAISSRLSEGPRYFPDEMFTDQPERILAAEFVREQVILHTREEIPFATAVEVLAFEELPERNLVRIHAMIYIERKSQKGILIGKGGQRLKSIGTQARKRIERMLTCRVFLDLRVKVKPDWSKTAGGLRSVGYDPS